VAPAPATASCGASRATFHNRLSTGGRVRPFTAGALALLLALVGVQRFDAQSAPSWLAYANRYRATAGLPFLVEEPTWSDGDVKHARYTVRVDVLGHSEDPASPEYTPEGDLAARNSNVMAGSGLSTSDQTAIDMWMRGPFHAVGIIDPRLARTGFGSFRESGASYQMAAAFDVLRGRSGSGASLAFPLMWPARGRSVPLTTYSGGEYPDPISGCGYTAPTGLPIILQLSASGSTAPTVTASGFLENGVALAHCVYSETSYVNADASAQSLGRAVLNTRDAVVLVPRSPLAAGKRYTASITVGGTAHTWSFRVGSFAHTGVARDADGDAVSDAMVYRPSSGTWFVRQSDTLAGRAITWGMAGDTPAAGDYDGDGKLDPAVYRASSGTWFVLKTATGSGVAIPWGAPSDLPVPADYDGDGRTDVAVFRPATGVWYIVRSSTNTATCVTWGAVGDVPVPADFDGDGQADPTVYRPSTGTWYQLRSTTGAGLGIAWGQNGDVPLAGDYDGDGKADPVVFRASTGMWYELRSTTGGGYGVSWGATGDQPVAGDYDGDGKHDPAVFRASSGTWYLLRTTTNTGSAIVWGAPNDLLP
jgi:uncharacterized protein YkwD